jgi:hypothetical protein
MPSSGMWYRETLVIPDVSAEVIASIVRVKRVSEIQLLVNTEVILNLMNLSTLMMEAIQPKRQFLQE